MTVIEQAMRRHEETLLALMNSDAMQAAEEAHKTLSDALRNGNTLFICGNGGSAADAQHFAAEWTCKYRDPRRPLPAIALTTDSSALTAIGNDFGFDFVFSRQIEALGKNGDVLVALTTSGQSRNVLEAVRVARTKGVRIIALTGMRGLEGSLEGDIVIPVPSIETARIQEMHELLYHAWCEAVDESL